MGKQADRMLIFKRQAHAFAHLLESPPRVQLSACPLCLHAFGDGDIHGCAEHTPKVGIEHAPPQQRTRFGDARGACLTHVDCQGAIGYECESGRYRNDLHRLRRGEEATLRGRIDGVDGSVTLIREAGVVRPVGVGGARSVGVPLTLPVAAQLTELKAAYLIAFTVLGYSWAAAPGLDSVRAAVQSGDATKIGSIPLFMTSDPHPDLANTVLVAEEADRIAVIGDDPMWGVLLPLRQPFTVTKDDTSLSMNGYALPWLPDRWWRQQPSPAFRWDCAAPRPLWRIELVDEPSSAPTAG